MLTLWLCTPKTTPAPAPKLALVRTISPTPLSWLDRLLNRLCGHHPDAVEYYRRE